MQADWKSSGWVWEIHCLPSADTIEGREISTAWPIIWSNGGPSVRNKGPRLFCISSSDDCLTLVPRRWSQLKAPSVKRLQPPDAQPQREIHTLSLIHHFTVMRVLFFIYFISLCVSASFPFFLSQSQCQASKSNFILSVLSRSAFTISDCLASSVISTFSIYADYIWSIQLVVKSLICEPPKYGLQTNYEMSWWNFTTYLYFFRWGLFNPAPARHHFSDHNIK